MTAPRDVLGAMAAGTPGILAAAVLGLDGSPVELLTFDPAFPVDTVIPEITMAAKLFLYLCRKLQEDRLDEFMVSGERYTVLAALPAPDRCVALFLSGKATVGKARVQLRRHLPELIASNGTAQVGEG